MLFLSVVAFFLSLPHAISNSRIVFPPNNSALMREAGGGGGGGGKRQISFSAGAIED